MNVLRRSLWTVLATLFVCSSLPLIAQKVPPVAPVREIQDKYFDQAVIDPYRWMENESDPELAAYLKAQDDYTRSVLAAIPAREKLLKRIKELDRAGTQVFAVQRWGEKYFYYKTEPGADIRKLYVRDGLNGRERLLVDPEKLGAKDTHYAIDFFKPSLDGKYVGYGLSPGGSENSTIYVVNAETGRILPDAIDRCLYSYLAWHPDNESFFGNES
jgi:prolyl oligopeptidase